MQYLELDHILEDVREDQTIEFERLRFNGGENHIKLKGKIEKRVTITTQLKNSDYVMELLMATDALRRAGALDIQLVAPYIPYGRQDRVMVPGEPLSIKVFADLINSQNYEFVWTLDNHSDVTTALLNNCKPIDFYRIIQRFIFQTQGDKVRIVSPDAGAEKKIHKLTKKLLRDVIFASKVRNVQTGQILRTEVHAEDLSGLTCVIVDDICDGGRTFVELAKVLKQKGAEKVLLYVSHAILPYGINAMVEAGIERIFTANCFRAECDTKFWSQLQIYALRKEDLK